MRFSLRRTKLAALVCAVISALIAIVPATAQSDVREIKDAIEAIQAYEKLVLENNHDLASLHVQLAEVEEIYRRVFYLSDTSVTVHGGYSYNPAHSGDDAHNMSGSATLSIPVLPQLSVSLQASSSGNASVSLSLNPFAGIGSKHDLEQQILSLNLAIAYKRMQLQWESRIALLQHMAARSRLEILSEIAEDRRLQYEEAEQQFKAGYMSTEDLRSAADVIDGAMTAYIGAMQQKAGRAKEAYILSGTDDVPNRLFEADVDVDLLSTLIADADAALATSEKNHPFTSQASQSLLMQKQFLEDEIHASLPIEPGISVSLSGSLSDVLDSPTGIASASVSLQVSGNSFRIDDIRDLRDELSEIETALRIDEVTRSIDEEIRRRELRLARLAAETSLRILEIISELAVQAERDLANGQISEFQYLESLHDRELAYNSYLASLIAVYGQVGLLLQSYTVTQPMEI